MRGRLMWFNKYNSSSNLTELEWDFLVNFTEEEFIRQLPETFLTDAIRKLTIKDAVRAVMHYNDTGEWRYFGEDREECQSMKVYVHTEFAGRYPVGTSAIIVAPNRLCAKYDLQNQLESIGLKQIIYEEDFIEVNINIPQVIILQDGDY